MNLGTKPGAPLLAVATIAAVTVALSAQGCSRQGAALRSDAGPLQDLGQVGLALILPDGTLVSSVRFVLNDAEGVTIRQGDINLGTDHGATVSAVIGAVRAGEGYAVTLGTDLGTAGTCQGMSAPFAVVATETTTVSVLLLCRAIANSGSVIVGGVMDLCPVVASFSISPLSVSVGATIDVSAVGFDPDPGDVVAYTWTSPGGTFESPHAPTTRFRCLSAGQHALTITVDDGIVPGSTPPRYRCSASESIPIGCTTSAGTGGASGQGGTRASGGASGAAVVLPPGCAACEANICAVQEPASGGLGCFTLTGSDKIACERAVACMRATRCAVDGDASYCYCGSANQDDGSCASAPLGPCVAALEAADPHILPADSRGTRFAKVAMDLVDPTLPLGKATGLIGCDALSCNTPSTCAGQF